MFSRRCWSTLTGASLHLIQPKKCELLLITASRLDARTTRLLHRAISYERNDSQSARQHAKPSQHSGDELIRNADRVKEQELHHIPAATLLTGTTRDHHDLESFLASAARRGLSNNSTVYKGTYYEYLVSRSLASLGLVLARIGQANDLGIDLLGSWTLPNARKIHVLVQCKMTKPQPQMIREMEGACASAPSSWSVNTNLALLVSQYSATKGVREALQRSTLPMGFLQINMNGTVKQFLWNAKAAEDALVGLSGATRHAPVSLPRPETRGQQDDGPSISLTWRGKPWSSSARP